MTRECCWTMYSERSIIMVGSLSVNITEMIMVHWFRNLHWQFSIRWLKHYATLPPYVTTRQSRTGSRIVTAFHSISLSLWGGSYAPVTCSGVGWHWHPENTWIAVPWYGLFASPSWFIYSRVSKHYKVGPISSFSSSNCSFTSTPTILVGSLHSLKSIIQLTQLYSPTAPKSSSCTLTTLNAAPLGESGVAIRSNSWFWMSAKSCSCQTGGSCQAGSCSCTSCKH